MSREKGLKETNRAYLERLKEYPQLEKKIKSVLVEAENETHHSDGLNVGSETSVPPMYHPTVDSIPSSELKADNPVSNEAERLLKPSMYLRENVLPEIKEPFTIDYHLSLDMRYDSYSVENHIPEYNFHFTKLGNISKVELVSLLISKQQILCDEPYIFLNIKELPGKYHLANGTRTFGKMLPSPRLTTDSMPSDYILYQPEACYQNFSKPINLEELTITFCTSNGLPINIREIQIAKVIISKADGLITLECKENHFLKVGDKIEIIIRRSLEMESYDIDVVEISNERSFKIKNDFKDPPTNQTRVFRLHVHLSLTLRLSEINWFLLTDGNILTAQLIKLTQLLKEKDK